MSKYPQKLVNVKLSSKVDISSHPQIADLVRAAEQQLGNNGRVLLRPSGTEPLLRVMVEGRDASEVNTLAHMLATEVQAILRD